MRKHLLAALLVLPLVNPWSEVRADEKGTYELLERNDGVTSWKLEVSGGVPTVKGQVEIDAGIEAVQRVIEDWRNHPKWMHRCVEAVELKRLSDSETIIYNRTDSPWPVKDRDVIIKLKREVSALDGEVLFSFASLRSNLKSEVDGVVRVPKMVGFYRLTRLGPKKTRVLYHLETDVGGALPKWAVKDVVEKLPYETLRGLRDRVSSL